MKPFKLSKLALVASSMLTAVSHAATQPNVIVMLADDLGYGEIQRLNPERGKIPTPHYDELSKSGMTFTDAHSASSVCTPTRYAMLTGRYAWRTSLQKGVIQGGESPISKDILTIPKMMDQLGYDTALIGKWHLGMFFDGKFDNSPNVQVGAKVTEGPIDKGGFDHYFGYHHSRQMNILIDDDTVTERIEPIEMLPRITEAAVDYIESRKSDEDPFFLYLPWNSPHSPVVPDEKWQGKSGLNAHADFVMQTDDSVGQVIDALKRTGQLNNTIIISSSDNGTSAPTADAEYLRSKGHYPSADFRGYKADLWEGGSRVPFFVSWPGVVKPDTYNDDLIVMNDIFATLADINDYSLPNNAAVDSYSFYPLLTKKGDTKRKNAIHHSWSGHFAIRQGKWKLLLASGSSGWTEPVEVKGREVQLYNMEMDKGEQADLSKQYPEVVEELLSILKSQVANGRSTEGTKMEAYSPVDIFKTSNYEKNKYL
ncbi:TPA: arylsulfatase [Vibrio parahaemolyticus]